METLENLASDDSGTCNHCQAQLKPTETYCSSCGYPQNGTEEEQSKFYRRIGAKTRLLDVIKKEVKKAKYTLVGLGIINAIFGVIYLFSEEDVITLIISAIVAIIYFGLAIWSDKEPFGAILTGLIVYGSLLLIQVVIDPTTLFRGLVWKIVIITFLIKGLKSGIEVRKVKAELSELGINRE